MKICRVCHGEGAFSYPCKKCEGTGIFGNSLEKGTTRCRVCGGTGRFYPLWKEEKVLKTFDFPYVVRKMPSGEEKLVHRCRTCKGTGRLWEKQEKK
jgi:DnaJ-class molecular chaperone